MLMELVSACVFLGLASAIMVHHRLKHGYWIDLEDIDNHETIALFLAGVGLGLLLSWLL